MAGPIPPFIRLISGFSVNEETGCWDWRGHSFTNGYGSIKVFGKITLAHRFSFELHKGPVPEGMDILHSCDNKLCVNPDHLRAGTHAENMREAAERGRIPSGDRHPSFGKTKPPGIKNKLSKPVVVAGKYYSSQNEAESALGLGSGTVRYWLRNNPRKARLISVEEYKAKC